MLKPCNEPIKRVKDKDKNMVQAIQDSNNYVQGDEQFWMNNYDDGESQTMDMITSI